MNFMSAIFRDFMFDRCSKEKNWSWAIFRDFMFDRCSKETFGFEYTSLGASCHGVFICRTRISLYGRQRRRRKRITRNKGGQFRVVMWRRHRHGNRLTENRKMMIRAARFRLYGGVGDEVIFRYIVRKHIFIKDNMSRHIDLTRRRETYVAPIV